MKMVTFAGESRVAVADAPRPEPRPGVVLVRIGASANCGSELEPRRNPTVSAWLSQCTSKAIEATKSSRFAICDRRAGGGAVPYAMGHA